MVCLWQRSSVSNFLEINKFIVRNALEVNMKPAMQIMKYKSSCFTEVLKLYFSTS